jgi:hypothetical protein
MSGRRQAERAGPADGGAATKTAPPPPRAAPTRPLPARYNPANDVHIREVTPAVRRPSAGERGRLLGADAEEEEDADGRLDDEEEGALPRLAGAHRAAGGRGIGVGVPAGSRAEASSTRAALGLLDPQRGRSGGGGGGGGGATIDAGSLHAEVRAEVATQDAMLDEMSANLERLGAVGHAITSELESQAVVVAEVDGSVDDTAAAMAETTRKVQAMVRENGGPGWCCTLVVLSGILAVLTYVALFT